MKCPAKMKHLWLTGLILLMAAGGWSRPMPFEPGEKLFFAVHWEQVPVAYLSLQVQPFQIVQGEEAYHFVFQAQTHPAMNALYPVDGQIEAFTDLALTRSLRLAKDMREGRSQRVYQVDFDWQSGIAHYENEKHKKRRIALPKGTLDLVSILYFARSLPLEAGMAVSRPLNTGKKVLMAKALVVRQERIVVDKRTWPAFLIEIDVRKAEGVFKKSKNAKLSLWLSADERKLPLKVVSKVWIGSFIVELTGASPEAVHVDPDALGASSSAPRTPAWRPGPRVATLGKNPDG